MFSRQQLTRYGFLAVLVAITLVFAGVWATAAYAQVALPGDALYSVKTGLEGAQVSLSVDPTKDASLHLQFADIRLNEMDRLIDQGRFDDLDSATGKFEFHIQEAIKSLATVAANNPEEARSLAISINETLSHSTGILTGLAASVPETAQPSIEHAILSSETALETSTIEFTGTVDSIEADSWVISGLTVLVDETTEMDDLIVVSDQVKVEGIINPDGAVSAEEIKLADDDDLNENDNDDINENDSDDINENDGDDLNDNDDDDLNENDDDDLNENDSNDLNENDGAINDNDDDLNDNDDDDLNDNDNDANTNDGDDDEDDSNAGGGNGGGDDDDSDDNDSNGSDDDEDDEDNDNNGGGDNDNG